MYEKINAALNQLEQTRGIRILFACESGSRAWGFPSPDSDYDVRFLYAQPLDWYLRIGTGKDTIDLGVDDDLLDITGWELRKTLQLLRKSNASPIDWIQSPIVYRADPAFRATFTDLSRECFSPIGTLFHYLIMAKRYAAGCQRAEPQKLKSWFYALRTALNCRWILRRGSAPPMAFDQLLPLVEETPGVREKIEAWMLIKRREVESYRHPGDPVLLALVLDCIREAEEKGPQLAGGQPSVDRINDFFRTWILPTP
ncbi:MAG: nucleotidyltransferase domain-containing protein [Bacteroidota bacterium]